MTFIQKPNGFWVQSPTSSGVGGARLDANFIAADYAYGAARPLRPALYRWEQVRPFFEACQTRRCDIALIGDSNMQASSVGMSLAYPRSWGNRFGWYATGVKGTNTQSNYTRDYKAAAGGAAAGDAVPGTHTAYSWAEIPQPIYIAGAFGEPFAENYYAIDADHPMHQSKIRWRFRYGTFSTGSGVIKPMARLESSYSYLANTSITTSTGSNGMADGYLEVPPGTRAGATWFSFQGVLLAHAPGAASGPFYSNYQRLEFPDAYTGVGVSTMYAQGGLGTRSPAVAVQAMTQTQFDEWAAAVVGYQNDDGMLLIQILEGANDTGFATTSVGPNPTAGDTAAGVVDNHDAIVIRIRALWAAAGYEPSNLYFLFGPYHPQDYSRRQWGLDLDDAMEAYADTTDNVAVVSRSRVKRSVYFSNLGRYVGVYPDDAHLIGQAYYDWGDEAVHAIIPA